MVVSVPGGGNGAAGEFGHNSWSRVRTALASAAATAVSKPCCSDSGLIRSWSETDPANAGRSIDDLAEAADAGDPSARLVLNDAGVRLGGMWPGLSMSSILK